MAAVRAARRDDLPRVLEIARASGTAAQWSPEQYRSYLAGDAPQTKILLLIALENQVRGFAAGRATGDEWELESIVVDPQMQCTGLGSHLLREFLNEVRQRGTAVFLEVRESNQAARKLYEKLDFREVGRRKAYYQNPQEDALVMKHSF